MDRSSNDNLDLEKKNGELLNSHSPNISSEWQLNDTNFANPPMGSTPSSISMVNSFTPTIWDMPTTSLNLGFTDINSSNSPLYGTSSLGAGLERTFGMGLPGMFVPNVPGMLPQSLAQIPADSGFIERAARFSCFGGGNFGDMTNPFSIHQPFNQLMPSVQSQKSEMNMAKTSIDASLRIDHEDAEISPLENERNVSSLVKSRDEAKHGGGGGGGASEMEFDDAGFSRHGGQEELQGVSRESLAKGLGSKKRKRICQDGDVEESKKVQHAPTETQPKEDQKTTSTTGKLVGKNGKQTPQTSDPPNEDYIHVRARKGQATNSHSLAERVRREKISERMKFLQDLVPGCNKVTGKAVMLDEIINYVQSLQRQVEFLSMKLATVNPRLEFNIESLLTKDIFQPRAGPSSSLGFPLDMTVQYTSPTSLIQTGLPRLDLSSDALRRSIGSQFMTMAGGYKDPTSQVGSVWEDELHNVIQMGLNSTVPVSSQDVSASLSPGHMKAEL